MPIDLEAVHDAEPSWRKASWTERDVLLYHLGVGAGHDEARLDRVFEANLRVLPTFAVVAGQGISAQEAMAPSMNAPGLDLDMRKILHAGQETELHQPIPTSGSARIATSVADVWDKQKAAVIVLEQVAYDDRDEPLWTNRMQVWARGEGGFGGEPGPKSSWSPPERSPDHVLETRTRVDQALLYRLSGDLNPLHADPEFASMAGFDRPILHGLCTYGIVARDVIDGVLDGDESRMASYGARFAGVVFPGETIRTSVWEQDGSLALVATCPDRDDEVVLSHAFMHTRA